MISVERIIPLEFLSKIGTELILSGGTLRVASGLPKAGSIVKHLRFPESQQATTQVLEQIKAVAINNQQALAKVGETVGQSQHLLNGIQAMQQATMLMQGANLAVSAIGFAIVINKLNKMQSQLHNMNVKLDHLLANTDEIQQYQALVQETKFEANMQTLAAALRVNDSITSMSAIKSLRESYVLYKRLTERLLDDVQRTYQQPAFFETCFKIAITSGLAIASAYSQLGQHEESSIVIQDIMQWQQDVSEKFMAPAYNKPVWLAHLPEQAKLAASQVVTLQKSAPQMLEYLKDQYALKCDNFTSVEGLLVFEAEPALTS
ncbi:hypothetical protein [Pelagibaculum spongiae]|uniref:Uncharacterized protein n=1 Tax=Pelagibaculum spongiae TaxID=2080658 RepID=A0A2V1GPB8_9GAMM|nr:hypothetical protein [Pelagibaculum spongiae]PVZ64477.1 hypothetical protein DC094_19380 [Pelagibaculum spongiae]